MSNDFTQTSFNEREKQGEIENMVTSRNGLDSISKLFFPAIFVAWNSVFVKISYNSAIEEFKIEPLTEEEMMTIVP